jgi:hypothetical protein
MMRTITAHRSEDILPAALSTWFWTGTYGPTPMHERVVHAGWRWLTKGSLARRITVGTFTTLQMFLVLSAWLAPRAVAEAAETGVSWTGITDSDGVPLANYMFVTDVGGFFDWKSSALAGLLEIEAGAFIAILALGLWLLQWALSFVWLETLRPAAEAVESALSFFQDPAVLLLTMSVAAAWICIPWVMGKHQLAVSKLIMVVIITLGGALAAQHSVSWIASTDGPLSYGRDVGVELAEQVDPSLKAGSSTGSVELLTGKLADALGRKPLQLWNFGTVADTNGGCRSAWSAGVKAGDEEDLATLMKNCGSEQIKEAIESPNGGQFGTGMLVIIVAMVILYFLALAAFKVLAAAAQCLFYAILSGPAFALAYLGGGSAAFAARCFADAIVSGLAMGVYTVFLAAGMLTIRAVLSSNETFGPAGAMVVLAVFLYVLIHLLKRLSNHLEFDTKRLTSLASYGSGSSIDPSPFHNQITQRIDSTIDGVDSLALAKSPFTLTARALSAGKRHLDDRLAATPAPALKPPQEQPTHAQEATAARAETLAAHHQRYTTEQAAAFHNMVGPTSGTSSEAAAGRAAAAKDVVAPEVAVAATVGTAVMHHHQQHQQQAAQQRSIPDATPGAGGVVDYSPPPPAPASSLTQLSPRDTAVQLGVDGDTGGVTTPASPPLAAPAQQSPWQRPVDSTPPAQDFPYRMPDEPEPNTSHPSGPLPWTTTSDDEPTAQPIQPPVTLPPGWGR